MATEASAIGHGLLLKAGAAFYQVSAIRSSSSKRKDGVFEVNRSEVNPGDRLSYQ